MPWSAEIAAGFGDLLDAVGEDVQWTDPYGVLQSGRALFKAPGQFIASSMQISDEYSMEYRDSDFVGLARDALVGILGSTFRVKDILPGDDPVLKVANLARAKV